MAHHHHQVLYIFVVEVSRIIKEYRPNGNEKGNQRDVRFVLATNPCQQQVYILTNKATRQADIGLSNSIFNHFKFISPFCPELMFSDLSSCQFSLIRNQKVIRVFPFHPIVIMEESIKPFRYQANVRSQKKREISY